MRHFSRIQQSVCSDILVPGDSKNYYDTREKNIVQCYFPDLSKEFCLSPTEIKANNTKCIGNAVVAFTFVGLYLPQGITTDNISQEYLVSLFEDRFSPIEKAYQLCYGSVS